MSSKPTISNLNIANKLNENFTGARLVSAKPADAFIYVDLVTAEEKNCDILGFLAKQSGVTKASYNRYIQQLVDVQFDPSKISCTGLVNVVKSQGYHSFVIAM